MGTAFQLEIEDDGIATLLFDLPNEKVNKLSRKAMEEFSNIIDEVSKNHDIKAMILKSGKKNVFIAGADINEINDIKNKNDALLVINEGQGVFNRLEALPFPTIAVIDGTCLGGGMELALACTHRVVSDNPKTQLGLPEVSLGVIPGWGGTQRLPRLVGLQEGLKMVLSGRPIPAKKAWKIKLADAIFHHAFIDEKAHEFALKCASPHEQKKILNKRVRTGATNFLLEKNPLGRSLVFKTAEKDLMKKTKGRFPAPIKALDVIKSTYTMDLKEGLKTEAQGFADVADGAISKNLIKLFFVSQDLKKDQGTTESIEPKTIKSAAVLGAGVMGGGIAWLMSYKNIPVRIKDINWDSIAKGYGQANDYYQQLVKKRKLTPGKANLQFHHISSGINYSGFQNADIIVEAVVENMQVKKTVLAELENNVRDDAIICTNTSALSVTEMASEMKHPERFVGMHFFNPVNRMPLVEIVPGEKTSAQTVATAVAFTKQLGKTPVVVGNCAGFVVNRILLPYMIEALTMLEEGIDFERIDKLLLDFGMPMGPFTLMDEVGIDVSFKVAETLEDAYGTRMKVPEIAHTLSKEKILGKKGGRGFYIYKKGKQEGANGDIKSLLPGASGNDHISDETIIARTVHMMINEASKCLEEKIIENPAYLDMAMIMGTGFPPFRGGVLRYADELGIKNVCSKLKQLSLEYGKRFAPSDYLLEMKRNEKTFY
ncbi:Fatty acid oxidation complex subunit alpha [Chlamydiales bacterium SCGC AG-110-M15]|nr:Fatty acid oxidation complex subunit alpha [Chlamydiales bacterium SCGC AG-110-M15]